MANLAAGPVTAQELNDWIGRIVRKTANESVTNNTTLQADDQLSLSVTANYVYAFDAYLLFDGAAATAGGLKLQFTGPSGAAMSWTNFGTNGAGSGALTDYNVVAESLAAGSPRGVGTNLGTVMTCQPKGTVVVGSSSGTLQLMWAQATANATATRILANSWIRLTRIS